MNLPPSVLKSCWFLAGPTAVGKSELSLTLAEKVGAEILSLDSMAIYRRMDIGTAKPSPDDLKRVPHHLVDLIAPHEEFSTASYLAAASAAAEEVLSRGKIPLFVGGTGLYLRALLRGLFEGPPADWEYRHRLEESARNESENWLHQQLAIIDPVTADRLHPRDTRRLIRALEIHHLTGELPSALHQQRPLEEHERPKLVAWLHPPRELLYGRINRRVDAMLERGLVDEVRSLLTLDPPLSRTASQALGYREVIDWLEGHVATLEEARELIQTRTRQFAKRQHTWFRNLEECQEVPLTGDESAETLCQRLLAIAQQ